MQSTINDREAGKYTAQFRDAADRFVDLHESEQWDVRGTHAYGSSGLMIQLQLQVGGSVCYSLIQVKAGEADNIFEAMEHARSRLVPE